MRNLLYITLAIFILGSCQDVKQPEVPENLIPQEKMMEILADAYVSNAARSGVNNRVLRTNGVRLDSLLYSNHGIDSTQFAESNIYYSAQLDLYRELILGAQTILTKRKAKIDTLLKQEKAKKTKDTLQETYKDKYAKPKLVDPVKEE